MSLIESSYTREGKSHRYYSWLRDAFTAVAASVAHTHINPSPLYPFNPPNPSDASTLSNLQSNTTMKLEFSPPPQELYPPINSNNPLSSSPIQIVCGYCLGINMDEYIDITVKQKLFDFLCVPLLSTCDLKSLSLFFTQVF